MNIWAIALWGILLIIPSAEIMAGLRRNTDCPKAISVILILILLFCFGGYGVSNGWWIWYWYGWFLAIVMILLNCTCLLSLWDFRIEK